MEKISDYEFVQLSKIKRGILERLGKYLDVQITNEEFFPELEGKAYYLVKSETLYFMNILIRFVNVSDFKAADEIHKLIEENDRISAVLIKDNGTLDIEVFIRVEENAKKISLWVI